MEFPLKKPLTKEKKSVIMCKTAKKIGRFAANNKNKKGEKHMKKTTFKRIAALLLALVVMIPVGMVGVFAEESTFVDDHTANTPNTTPNTPDTPKITATEGWGDPDGDGIYEIATAGDLLAMVKNRQANNFYSGKTIILTADIDFNPGWDASSNIRPTNEWTPSEKINGVIDGRGHTIRGIFVNESDDGDEMSFANFIRNTDGGFTMKNIKFENCLFYASKSAAGLIGFVRGPVVLENVYADIICEVGDEDVTGYGVAAGFVCRYRCTGTKRKPTVEMTNCVFAGKVIAPDMAAAFVGTNDRSVFYTYETYPKDHPQEGEYILDAQGKPIIKMENGQPVFKTDFGESDYHVTMTDCANYGEIICAKPDGTLTNGLAAGLIAEVANNADLTRCYNAGTLKTAGTAVGLFNVRKSDAEVITGSDVAINVEDCYYLAAEGVVATTKSLDAVGVVTMKYDGVAATEAKTATVTELLAKNAFKASTTYKGWTTIDNGAKAVPMSITCLDAGHTYTSAVTAPTCSTMGFTTYTCSKCDYTYEGDLVVTSDHTAGDWVIDKEATEQFAGMKHKECTVCQEVLENAVIPRLEATETTAPETEAVTTAPADTDAETDATEPDKKDGGCGSSIALGSALGMVSIIGLGAFALGKKRR